MDCTVTELNKPSQWQVNFVPESFHIILLVIAYIIRNNKVVRKLSWLVDVVASAILLYGTYNRTLLLNGQAWPTDCKTAITTEYKLVSKYLILSITSWLAIVVLDAKTLIYIFKSVFGKIDYSLSLRQWLRIGFYFLMATNSVVVMLHFCTDVHQTFEYLTKEIMLILYYWIAASLKLVSAFSQGVFFSSWIIDHPIRFLPGGKLKERKMMFRMAFINVVGLCHLLGLAYFSVLNSATPWTFGKKVQAISLILDFVYRMIVSYWYARNSYCCLVAHARAVYQWLPQASFRIAEFVLTRTEMTLHYGKQLLRWIIHSLRTLLHFLFHCLDRCFDMCEHALDCIHDRLLETLRRLRRTAQCETGPQLQSNSPNNEHVIVTGPAYSHLILKRGFDIVEYCPRRARLERNDCSKSGELVLSRWPNSDSLIIPCWEDNTHLSLPVLLSDNFPFTPCIQEAQTDVPVSKSKLVL